ncbi:MAG: tRNA (adenosine(37)-N6)-dimethylallyltransferase MiaA [Saprospiraceae bacterium]|nr:tRNA (adenosine(37)-N6)-dimethylallyltransferase MiaA [Candidatus Vicinibacter affinis]
MYDESRVVSVNIYNFGFLSKSVEKSLIVISGPTGIGKTDLALKLAKQFKTSIISADSRQIYQNFNIGTAKPTPEQLASVKHYFIDHLSPDSVYSAGQFALEANDVLSSLFSKHNEVILCGGTGLYIKALVEGLDVFPEVDPEIRNEMNSLYDSYGLIALQRQLAELDPVYYSTVDLNNPHRLIRALAVIKSSGKPFSFFTQNKVNRSRPYQLIEINLGIERSLLYERIDRRVDNMILSGLIQEVESLLPYKDSPGMNTVGYKEILEYMNGTYDLNVAIEKIKQHSRNYAKRQIIWFNKYSSAEIFHPEDLEGIQNYIEEKILCK